jgi:glycosyltransferase involved in cell wall biosynthesis
MVMNPPDEHPSAQEPFPQLTIVLPAYGEADNLRSLLPSLLTQPTNTRLQIVVVDDHSKDDTFDVVREWAARDSRVEGLRLARNSGSHLAILCGLRAARGAAAVVLAADGQDPPDFVPRLVAAWREGAQVVWAVREGREEEAASTVFLSRAYYWLMNTIGDVRLPPSGADFFLIDRRVIEALLAIPEYRISLFALIASLGFRQVEIPYVKRARSSGVSKWTLRKKVRLLLDSLTGFSTVPLRLATVLGFAYASGGFIYAFLLVANKLSSGRIFGGVPVNGFAALMTVLLISSGCIMVVLGIFGEYLSRALEQVRGRPRFLVEDSTDSIGRPSS